MPTAARSRSMASPAKAPLSPSLSPSSAPPRMLPSKKTSKSPTCASRSRRVHKRSAMQLLVLRSRKIPRRNDGNGDKHEKDDAADQVNVKGAHRPTPVSN